MMLRRIKRETKNIYEKWYFKLWLWWKRLCTKTALAFFTVRSLYREQQNKFRERALNEKYVYRDLEDLDDEHIEALYKYARRLYYKSGDPKILLKKFRFFITPVQLHSTLNHQDFIQNEITSEEKK